jgi:hypothetical protein
MQKFINNPQKTRSPNTIWGGAVGVLGADVNIILGK